jgi:hypothetical protein
MDHFTSVIEYSLYEYAWKETFKYIEEHQQYSNTRCCTFKAALDNYDNQCKRMLEYIIVLRGSIQPREYNWGATWKKL